MSILLVHLLFLSIGMLSLYVLRSEKYIGIAYILISFISLLFSFYIASNGSSLINVDIKLIEIIGGINIAFSLDYIGIIFLLLSSFLWLMISIFSDRYLTLNKYNNKSKFYIFFTLSMLSTYAIIYSSNLLTTFIFYEILTLSTYPLVTFKNDSKSLKKGKIYLYYLLGTSIIFFLPAIIATHIITGSLTYTYGGIFPTTDSTVISLILILFLFGIGKSAIMPFHKWLPSAMVAPTPVSALLHAVAVVKSGVFILIKVCLYIFGVDALTNSGADNIIITFASITIILSSIIALQQDNIKLRLAYSTIGQLSYIVLATGILASYSIVAAILHLVFHALGKVILFLSAGVITTQTGIKNVSGMNNLASKLPITCFMIVIGSFIMVGLPPTIGFISKWYLISGIIDSGMSYLLIVIVISTLLNAGYYFPMIYKSYFISDTISDRSSNDEDTRLIFPILIIAITSIVLFFNTDLFIIFINRYII